MLHRGLELAVTERILALTIWQPWGSLIVGDLKPYEFRKWDYRSRYPGLVGQRIAIHAGARPARRDEIADLLSRLSRKHSMVAERAVPHLERWHLAPGSLPLSAILGTAILGEPRRAHTLLSRGQSDSCRSKLHADRPSYVGVAAHRY